MNYINACLINMFIKKISSKNLNTYLDGTNSNMHRVKLRNVSGKALIRQMKLSLFPFYSMIAFAFTILSVVYISHGYILIKSHTALLFCLYVFLGNTFTWGDDILCGKCHADILRVRIKVRGTSIHYMVIKVQVVGEK